ncbi:type IV secretion system protein VirB10 [Variovorax sp. OK605]|uniref:TrbI/VirB10 family protein n=1 Tax=Variovorax sp. OK605 TaxID=1855317 RepID=UPI0008EF2200|nr:TrbI/VirB10 family protein [Variovorax sp. OK605]SFQ70407.1 type IV secretion system protein VirB10 [Variovorax sp. OK605]
MFERRHEQPVAEEERDGIVEPARGNAPGQKLILVGTACLAALLILFGIMSRNNFFGWFGAPRAGRGEVAVDARPVGVPEVPVPLSLAGPAGQPPSYVECPGGVRLPLGLECPAPSVAPAPSSAASSGESLAQRVRERRLKGSIAPGVEVGDGAGATMATRIAAGDARSTPAFAATVDASAGGAAVLGRSLSAASTPGASAALIANPTLTLGKGSLPDCTLLTAVLSDQPGFLKCVLSAPVYSMDGKVILMEAGTTLEGEYAPGVQAGQSTIFTLWTRAVTPHFVAVPLNSPGTDVLGRSGTPGHIDNKWFERFAGAVFFSLFEDAKQIAMARDEARAAQRASSRTGDTFNIGTQGTLSRLGNTDSTTQSVVQEMLRQGSAVRPSLTKNQGEVIKIYVARDVDFSDVYELRPVRAP